MRPDLVQQLSFGRSKGAVRHILTTTTATVPQTVLTQTPAAGAVLHPGATVSLTMQRCPQ